MKKLDNKMLNRGMEEGIANDRTDVVTCDCCNLPSITSLTEAGEYDEDFDQRHDHPHEDKNKEKFFDNPKLLIGIGLALTIPIVLLEITHHNIITDYVTLALATPVQFILGKPFYIRFYRAVIRQKKCFTTDTLVVLSTTVAYGYSLVSLLEGADLQFFEASASVLTIFTIGEYLETRVLKTTTESIRNLLALKPKTALVIRDGKEIVIDADALTVGDIVVVKPGEKISADGKIVYGQSSIDECVLKY